MQGSRRKSKSRRVYCQPRFDVEVVDQLETLVDAGKYTSVSKAIEELTLFGLQVANYKDMLDDPKRAESLQKRIKNAMKSDDVFAIAQGLDEKRIMEVIEIMQFEQQARRAKKEGRRKPTITRILRQDHHGNTVSVEDMIG